MRVMLDLTYIKFDPTDVGRKVEVMSFECKLLHVLKADYRVIVVEFADNYLAQFDKARADLFEEMLADYRVNTYYDNTSIPSDEIAESAMTGHLIDVRRQARAVQQASGNQTVIGHSNGYDIVLIDSDPTRLARDFQRAQDDLARAHARGLI